MNRQKRERPVVPRLLYKVKCFSYHSQMARKLTRRHVEGLKKTSARRASRLAQAY